MTRNTLIVGYGITGNNLEKEIKELEPDIADKKIPGHFKVKAHIKYDLIFICVDTPYVSSDNPCDLTAIHEVIKEYSTYLKPDGIFVIKSTVLPGTTIELSAKYNYKFVFSPEYYGNTKHCNNFDFDFTILGGEEEDCIRVIQILEPCYIGKHSFRIVDSKTAELAKYMENCYLAMKVCFCNQFYNIAKDNGVSYEKLRELFILDPRVNPSHTIVYPDQRWYDSHCLNKDVKAIAESEYATLLLDMIKFNEEQKDNY